MLLGVARSIPRIKRPYRETICRGDEVTWGYSVRSSNFVNPGPRYLNGTVGERFVEIDSTGFPFVVRLDLGLWSRLDFVL